MDLRAIYDKQDDIPETVPFRELFVEKNGKWELNGITGVKTQADVDRLTTANTKERGRADGFRDKLKLWGDGSKVGVDSDLEAWTGRHTELMASLDRMPELEAAAKGKLDEAQIEEIVTRRVDGTLKAKLAGPERQIRLLTTERDELLGANEKFTTQNRIRKVHDAVRKAAGPDAAKMRPEAVEDALELANRIFEVTDDGAVVTRDQVGVTPGLEASGWLAEIQPKKPHWWPGSTGGGARGSGAGGGFGGGPNPWATETWNSTKQGQFYKEHGAERAEQMAKAAGTTIGGARPKAKAAAG